MVFEGQRHSDRQSRAVACPTRDRQPAAHLLDPFPDSEQSKADVLGVDLIEAARVKLAESDRRYDVETYRGSARKAPPLP